MAKIKFETPDMTAENIEKIAELFPNCVTEMRDENGKIKRGINFEMLKQMLSPDVVDGDECYEFTWVGKKASIVEANKPIRKTLRPCPEESKNWDTTENLYIEGDNLEVLKLLQESYLGKVKMIYIDPPYNTGNDFIYADDFMRSQEEENEQMGMYDEDENRLFKNADSNGRFHSNWCSMMYSRLMLARNLLSDDGIVFISIDDCEMVGLRNLCNEVFGSANFVAEFCWKSKPQGGNDNKYIVSEHEYIVVFAKNIFELKVNGQSHKGEKYKLKDDYYFERGGYSLAKLDNSVLEYRVNLDYPVETPDGTMIYPGGVSFEEWNRRHNGGNAPRDWQWRWSKERLARSVALGLSEFKKNKQGIWQLYSKEYERVDNDGQPIERTIKYRTVIDQYTTIDGTREIDNILGHRIFTYPKPIKLLQLLVHIGTNINDIVLDFFSGSATTANAVMQLNAEDGGHRKFIMVQLPETCDEQSEAYKAGYKNICEIGKERIRRAGEKIKAENGLTAQNLDVGFRVLKLDDSNMKDVYYAADDYDQRSLLDMVSNIKDDRDDLDLLFGCLLDWGLPLSLSYKSEQIEGCTVHTYNDGDLIACFDANIPESVVRAIAERKPLRAVFRDSGFADSPAKINVFEIFKLYMPEDADDISKRVRVI